MSVPSHLRSPDDLITKEEAVRAGFLAIAVERSRLSTPFVAQAQALKVAAISAGSVERCVADAALRPALLAAAGVSDKGAGHLTDADKNIAIKNLADTYMAPAGTGYVDELVFRYLLAKGDAVGGIVRNEIGRLAQRKLVRALAAALDITGVHYYWLDRDKIWHTADSNLADFELHANGLNWAWQGKNRTLLFNRRVPTVGTNVDLCLLNCERDQANAAIRHPGAFVALGELKGGGDPAGADEHWKTARSALTRIHTAFSNAETYPSLFFVGAAIAKNMAIEICGRLENNTLANAANLTDDDQLAAIAQWIRTL